MSHSAPNRRPTLLVILVVCGLPLAGCTDLFSPTTPDDPPERREDRPPEVEQLRSSGFLAPSESCDAVGASGKVVTRFALLGGGTEGPFGPNTGPERNLAAEEVEVNADEGRIFESPDVKCVESGEGPRVACQRDGYSCTAELPGDSSADVQRTCSRGTDVEVTDLSFESPDTSNRLFGVLVENTASTDGLRPPGFEGMYYDADGDGEADRDETLYTDLSDRDVTNPVSAQSEVAASDPSRERFAALQHMLATREDVAETAPEDVEISTSVWELDGNPSPTNAVSEVAGADSVIWTRDNDVLREAADELISDRDSSTARANVLEATHRVIREGFSSDDGRYDGFHKTLVVLVDGPPELHSEATGVTVDDVADAASSANVELVFVQLDTRLNRGAVLDDFEYARAQSESCSSDADCRQWETCRDVRGWASQPGPVGEQFQFDGKRCMPERRDVDGRAEPIAAYSRLACQTGGGYQYLKAPGAMTRATEWFPHLAAGAWRAELSVDALENGDFTPNAAVRFGMTLGATTEKAFTSRTFSKAGAKEESNQPTSDDNRGVLFTADQQ